MKRQRPLYSYTFKWSKPFGSTGTTTVEASTPKSARRILQERIGLVSTRKLISKTETQNLVCTPR